MEQNRIFLSPPHVTESEEKSILEAFRSGWIAPLGPDVTAFEHELSQRCERKHAVVLSSGTAGLHLGLLELGVKPGDVVMVASFTFIATASAVVSAGATPCFVDSDDQGLMDAELLEIGIKDQLNQGNRVAAIIPVDLLGKIADYSAIAQVADRYGIPVLSDAAESLGAKRHGRPAGSYGDVSVISFNGNKIMTTSGGGALFTDEEHIAEHVRHLATQAREPYIHYEHKEVGFNYRLSNILAALGRAQLARIDDMIAIRRRNRLRYQELFSTVAGVEIFGQPDGSTGGDTVDNFWLTSIIVNPQEAGWDSRDLMKFLSNKNIESRPLWKPMHLQPVFKNNMSYCNGVSDNLFRTGLSLPSGSSLNEQDWVRIEAGIQEFVKESDVCLSH